MTELIKDLDGRTYLAFDKPTYNETINAFNSSLKSDDFEVLMKLGEGAFGKVFKVRSKLDNNIYAMKKLNIRDLREKNEKAYQLTINETEFLSHLSHPHIIKYYKSFVEGDFLYILIEFIANGDMESFIDAHKSLGQHIPEDELWSIFLQCMKGLVYVHENGVIHRDIKPANLLMDNNLTIKLGDFGVSAVKTDDDESTQYKNANYNFFKNSENMKYHQTFVGTQNYMAKEIVDENEYDQKVDVYAMGVSFFEMCYFHIPKKCMKKRDAYGNIIYTFKKVEEPEDKNVNYSREMLDIINLMLEEDKDKRKTSKEILELIQKEFSIKYMKNTSIDAIVRCLYSFKDIREHYINLSAEQISKKPVTQAYIKCLKSFTDQDIEQWFSSIKYFREIICVENTKFDKTKEIEPRLVLAFLINRLHNELNDNSYNETDLNKHCIVSGEQKAKTSKQEMLLNFINEFLPKFNSFVSKQFLGLTKISDICNQCQMKTYSFGSYFFATFDLESILAQNKIPVLNIDQGFAFQNNYLKRISKFCQKCIMQTNHIEYKQFYSAPDFLIISIQRGLDYSCRIPVLFRDMIDISKLVEMEGKQYRLVGFINKNYENEKYYSIINFNGMWFKCEDKNISQVSGDIRRYFNDQNGELIMAFYEAINKQIFN